ncbi:MAG: hypothetical protein ACC653_03580, partial [Gammaproteobacteria bacterium]
NEDEHSVFSWVIERSESVWVKNKSQLGININSVKLISDIIEVECFILNPLVINNKIIGVFYSDRKPSGRDISAADYESCKHFAQQACFAVDHIWKNN